MENKEVLFVSEIKIMYPRFDLNVFIEKMGKDAIILEGEKPNSTMKFEAIKKDILNKYLDDNPDIQNKPAAFKIADKMKEVIKEAEEKKTQMDQRRNEKIEAQKELKKKQEEEIKQESEELENNLETKTEIEKFETAIGRAVLKIMAAATPILLGYLAIKGVIKESNEPKEENDTPAPVVENQDNEPKEENDTPAPVVENQDNEPKEENDTPAPVVENQDNEPKEEKKVVIHHSKKGIKTPKGAKKNIK